MAPSPLTRTRHVSVRAAVAIPVLICAGLFVSCDDDPPPVPPPDRQAAATTASEPDSGSTESSVDIEGWRLPHTTNLAAPSNDLERRHLSLAAARRFGECHTFLERGEGPKKLLSASQTELETKFFGCDIPAAQRVKNRLYLAYPVPDTTHEGTDLRLAVYGQRSDETNNRELLWAHRMDRRAHARNFEANKRSSFVAPLPPNVVCMGTLWAGNTQAACISYDGSTVEWSGTLDFWSSIQLQPADNSLVGADVSGLTRRYPYSGVEMNRRDLPGRGGHSALYAVADDKLLYVPEPPMSDDTYPLTLSAWQLDDFEPRWRRKLPNRVDPAVNYLTFPPLILLKIGRNLVAVDLGDGSPAWAAEVGSDRPKAARSGDTLYLLIRRRKAPNLLYALKLKTGDVQWFARTPHGFLDVETSGDNILLKSIRAVHAVESVGPVPEDAPPINSTDPDRRTVGTTTGPDDPQPDSMKDEPDSTVDAGQ